MTGAVTYGVGLPDERELRLVGDIAEGGRVVELGVSDFFNSIPLANAGARTIAVDPSVERIEELRKRADVAEVRVQCFTNELADLGDITSSSCAAVIAVHTLNQVDDLSRVLRQVHRILRPGSPFVFAVDHPFSTATPERPYGSTDRTVGEWFTALARTNFRVDQLHELGAEPAHPLPTTLVVKAHKEGN